MLGGFEIAVLGMLFAACGHRIPIDVLSTLPVPGCFGAVEAGLAGSWIAYGAPATDTAAAVVSQSTAFCIQAWAESSATCVSAAASRAKWNTRGTDDRPLSASVNAQAEGLLT